jgi:thioredoxin reductase
MNAISLPVAVIGAGPVGLAAAAHLVQRGETPLVLEAGASVGASMLEWAHVQVFSPWQYNIDAVAGALLDEAGWSTPLAEEYPTGGEIVDNYLRPLAELPQIKPHIRLNSRVTAITRQGFDKMKSNGRKDAPFLLQIDGPSGEERILAKAVIDASGTYSIPNPLGSGGLPAFGERAAADHIFYGIPDVLGAHRERYTGKRILIVGSGHSAFNALNDLVTLKEEEPGTAITWAVRRKLGDQMYGGGENDALPQRGALGRMVQAQVESGRVTLVTEFRTTAIQQTDGGIVLSSDGQEIGPFDEIVATTGFRPDLSMHKELRLDLDPTVESPVVLAPMIDPNIHSCGTVRPHGALELKHPERDFYIVGMKSYGRAPTFLMLTGYEQVRSVVAALAGDWASARDVQLVLPETGVCSGGAETVGCCTPEVPAQRESILPVLQPAGATDAGSNCCG